MSWKIGMPSLGHTMEEGKLVQWLKAVGDLVKAGEVIAIVESDKASFDVEVPADGVLLSIDVAADTVVPVGTILGVVGQLGEVATPPPHAPAVIVAQQTPFAQSISVPLARRNMATPAARTLATELGVDLAGVTGNGEDGMITRDDVRAAASKGPVAAMASPLTSLPPKPKPMRRAIAEATEHSWRSIPHVTLMRRADVTELTAGKRIPLTVAIVLATARALKQHPTFNGWYLEHAFQAAASIDIAVATSTHAGLLMPVLRAADTRSAADIAAQIERHASAARAGTLAGEHLINATFAVTSLGRWGVEAFTPIISAPQVGILGVGAIARNARESETGVVGFRSELELCLAFDHRANDGVGAAEFLATIVGELQQRAGA
jgi:pyruvate dehydrogenase E2 component (dihydrolipoamide acetyltransferase)